MNDVVIINGDRHKRHFNGCKGEIVLILSLFQAIARRYLAPEHYTVTVLNPR